MHWDHRVIPWVSEASDSAFQNLFCACEVRECMHVCAWIATRSQSWVSSAFLTCCQVIWMFLVRRVPEAARILGGWFCRIFLACQSLTSFSYFVLGVLTLWSWTYCFWFSHIFFSVPIRLLSILVQPQVIKMYWISSWGKAFHILFFLNQANALVKWYNFSKMFMGKFIRNQRNVFSIEVRKTWLVYLRNRTHWPLHSISRKWYI